MCGPSKSQQNIAAQQASLSSTMMANYNANYAAQKGILDSLNSQLTPIAAAGPDQQGFGQEELAALNTQAGEGVAANYSKASQALNEQMAAQGGGNEFLPNGARNIQKETLASQAAAQSANEGLAITRANYAQGRQNWQSATSGLNALAEGYAPNQVGGLASSTGNSAFGEATEVNKEKGQLAATLGGALKAGLGVLSGGLGNLDFTGSSNAGEQIGNFFGGI